MHGFRACFELGARVVLRGRGVVFSGIAAGYTPLEVLNVRRTYETPGMVFVAACALRRKETGSHLQATYSSSPRSTTKIPFRALFKVWFSRNNELEYVHTKYV